MFVAMAYIAKMDIGDALTTFVVMMIGAIGWHGGHNNIIKIAGGKLTIKNIYFIWMKRKEVDLDNIQKVVAKGGTRFRPTTFTCFFKDGNTFEFHSGLINPSETRRLLSVILEYGIDVETYRI